MNLKARPLKLMLWLETPAGVVSNVYFLLIFSLISSLFTH